MSHIKTMLAIFAVTPLLFGAPAFAQSADDALGIWLNPENQSHTQFYKCGDNLCGKIVKAPDGQKTDDKNADPAKRNRPIIGLVILENAKKSGPASWSGTLYNRADGKSYSGTVTVKSNSILDLSGCVAKIFCKTLTFTRVQ